MVDSADVAMKIRPKKKRGHGMLRCVAAAQGFDVLHLRKGVWHAVDFDSREAVQVKVRAAAGSPPAVRGPKTSPDKRLAQLQTDIKPYFTVSNTLPSFLLQTDIKPLAEASGDPFLAVRALMETLRESSLDSFLKSVHP